MAIRLTESADELHARPCPIKNAKNVSLKENNNIFNMP